MQSRKYTTPQRFDLFVLHIFLCPLIFVNVIIFGEIEHKSKREWTRVMGRGVPQLRDEQQCYVVWSSFHPISDNINDDGDDIPLRRAYSIHKWRHGWRVACWHSFFFTDKYGSWSTSLPMATIVGGQNGFEEDVPGAGSHQQAIIIEYGINEVDRRHCVARRRCWRGPF